MAEVMTTVVQFKAVCRLLRVFGFPKDTPISVVSRIIDMINEARREYMASISEGKNNQSPEAQSEAAGL